MNELLTTEELEQQEWDENISRLFRQAEAMGVNPDHYIGEWLGGLHDDY